MEFGQEPVDRFELVLFYVDTGLMNWRNPYDTAWGGLVLTCCEDFFGAVLGKTQLFDWEPIRVTCETTMFCN